MKNLFLILIVISLNSCNNNRHAKEISSSDDTSDKFFEIDYESMVEDNKLLPILRTTIGLFLIDLNHSYDDVKQC